MARKLEEFSRKTEIEYQKLHVPLALRMTCECGKWIMCFYKGSSRDNPLVCSCGRKYWCEDRTFYVEEPQEDEPQKLTRKDVRYLISMLGAHRHRILQSLWSHPDLSELERIEKIDAKLEKMLKLL